MATLMNALNASASALDVQRARMEVAVSNMANAESTHNGPYRRREVVLETMPMEGDTFGATLSRGVQAAGVKVSAVVEDQTPFRRRYDPTSVDADADGYVALPNVDVPEEMVDMVNAARAYQANLQAISLIRDTFQKSLDLAK